jgi:lipopolysaccharide export system permease protein
MVPGGRVPSRALLRLQRYLLGELLTAFLLVTLIVTMMILTAMLLQTLQKYPQLSMIGVLEILPLLLGIALPLSIPMSFLMACLLSYGRFADDNEFLAFQMGGLSPWHAVAPAVCAAAFVSLATLTINTDVNPILRGEMNVVVHGQIREQVAQMRSPSVTHRKINDTEMSWDDRVGDWYRDVFLTWSETGADGVKKTNRLRAKQATIKLTDEAPLRLVIHLEGVDMPSGGAASMTEFRAGSTTVVINMDDTSLTEPKRPAEMRSSELYYRVARLESQLDLDRKSRRTEAWEQYRKLDVEYWRRVALGLSPFVFAILGVPLGLVVRRGSRALALVVALLIALPVYYPMLLLGDSLARQDRLPAMVALNLGNILLAVIGIVLLRKLLTR